MPKKKQWGTNPRAEASRERKATAKEEATEKKRRDEEDAYWRDDDKHAAKKEQKKVDQERRKLEQAEKKRANKQLLEEEESKLVGKKAPLAAKVTRAEIEQSRAQEMRKKQLERSSGADVTGDAPGLPKGVTAAPELLQENPNKLLQQSQVEGEVSARGVEEAIAVLRVGEEKAERHPERRMKAAYAAYEERELPKLKAENPNLRLSQLKQMLRKDWMKSPENPLNQDYVPFNR